VGNKDAPFWVRDLDDLRRVFTELTELRSAGYPLLGDERQFAKFHEYLADPPLEDQMRHLDLAGEKRNCDIGLRSMFVYPNGDVFFCDFLKKPIGNIHQNSLDEIYYGTTADGQRQRMVYCNIDCQQTCKRPIPLREKARTFLRMG
jgi:MoaA/NifB/PqqE/SkfB family radical SAM enzyme